MMSIWGDKHPHKHPHNPTIVMWISSYVPSCPMSQAAAAWCSPEAGKMRKPMEGQENVQI